ncbi:unnamed protein product [Linum trigynum]|uniref:Uncharacterized protein n=1 Tax=Linum trigynum TaxID=586398 RepID=A0AAV2EXK6_9ROSI
MCELGTKQDDKCREGLGIEDCGPEAKDRHRDLRGPGRELHVEGALEKQRVSLVASRPTFTLLERKIEATTRRSRPRSQPAISSLQKAMTTLS